jgi:VWFA-related protein
MPVNSQDQRPTFRASTEAVPLIVAATTPSGEPVEDLTAADFEVFDNGRRSELVAFSYPARPVAIRMLVSQTPSIRDQVPRVRALAQALINRALPDEQVGIGGLWQTANRQYNAFGPFTNDKNALRREFEVRFQPITANRLDQWGRQLAEATYTLQASTTDLLPSETGLGSGELFWSSGALPGIAAVIVLSPGVDQRSVPKETSEYWLRRARLDGSIIHAVGFAGRRADERLARIAIETSGWYLEPDKKNDISVEADRILTDLRTRYLLGFVPVVFDEEEHTLSVRVRRPGVIVRARVVYKAPPPPLPQLGSVQEAESEGRAFQVSTGKPAKGFSSRSLPGTSERRCVEVESYREARSGDFVAGNFAEYPGLNRLGSLSWTPAHVPTERQPLTIRFARLDRPGPGSRAVFVARAEMESGQVFFPSRVNLPTPGRWMLVATSGPNWGCFILDLRQ